MNPESREEPQRQERIRSRLARAFFRLEMAELERIWAIVSAHREGMSVWNIAPHAGLSPTRVHQLVTSPLADCVEQALPVLRETGWPTPEDPLPGAEEQFAGRLTGEAEALISCAAWLASLAAGETVVVNLRPSNDLPDSDSVAVDQDRVIRGLRRIAYDIKELARSRRVTDLSSRENDAGPRLRLRRRMAEPPIEISRRGTSIRQSRQAWEDYESRLRRAKRDEHGRREEDQRDEGSEQSAWEGHASSILSRPCQGCVKVLRCRLLRRPWGWIAVGFVSLTEALYLTAPAGQSQLRSLSAYTVSMRHSTRWLAGCLLSTAIAYSWQQPQRPRTPPPKPQSELERAVEEFKVLTRDLGLRPDEPGKRVRGASTRPAWHGRIFENFRNDKLDATPHDVVQRGGSRNLLRRNQFGFNVGGPVVIPKLYDGSRKTFFNISYEGVRERIGRSFLRTIAIAPERSGDFSQTVDNAGLALPVYDPQSTRANPNFNPANAVSAENLQYLRDPFPGNALPAARLDPVALKAVSFYPLPNSDAGPFFRNNYFVFSPETNQANGMILKVDHSPAEKHRLTFNGSFTNGRAGASRYFDTIADSNNNDRDYSARRGTMDWTYTRSAATIHAFTMDVQSDRSVNGRPGQENALASIGLRGPLRDAFPVFGLSTYLGMGRNNPVSRSSHNYYYFTESFSTRKGKHRLRGIGQYRRYQVNAYMPENPAGAFQFGPSITSLPGINNSGHPFASFLLGLSESASATVIENPSYWRGRYWRLQAADSYEHSKNLTLSASFATEISQPRVEKYDRFASVDLNAINPANGLPGALVFANRDGRGRSLQPTRVRPEASIGTAWNPGGDSKSVVRLSYGLSFSNIPIYTTQWATQGFVGVPTLISPNIQLQPALRLADGMPPLPRPLPDLRPDAANFTNADLVDATGTVPMYQSAGLSMERELPGQAVVSISLGHARGQRLFVSNSAANPNAIPVSNLAYRDALNTEAFRRTLRPYPQYQRFDVYSSWPVGNYKRNAAAFRVEKRSSSGLTLNGTYELSKQMDDYSGPYGIQDFYNRQNEWSLTSSNNPHRISLSFAYELPIGSKKGLMTYSDWRRYFVDGWSVSGITSLQSGEPLALRPQFNNTGGVVDALRVNLAPGVEPAVAKRGPDLWFNPAAFEQPADFTIGNGPRTHPQLLAPGGQNHDLSVTKRFAVTAEQVIELTATGFNFTNTGNWADPDVMIGPASAPNVNAGKIIGSRGGRVIQVGVRLSF